MMTALTGLLKKKKKNLLHYWPFVRVYQLSPLVSSHQGLVTQGLFYVCAQPMRDDITL